MAASNPASIRPSVSVIVPARNEEVSIGDCLTSLVAQSGVSFEVIVVDDGSTDRTRAIAESFPGVRAVAPGPLPEGWSGKNNAMAAGAQQAKGEWLLFTDADTVHLPGSLARSVEEVRRHGAALLSYSPMQEVRSFWEKAVMPVVFAELASTFKPSQVNDPGSTAAAANGQYILISREAYDATGGHTAIARDLLEDVALVRAVKMSGRKIFFRYGGDAVRTRMYRSFAQMRDGWTKNLALLFRSPLKLAGLRLTEFVVMASCAVLTILGLATGDLSVAVASALVGAILYTVFLLRVGKAHFGWDANLLALFGLPIFAYLLLRSRVSFKQGTVVWKGRTYGRKVRVEPIASPARGQAGHVHPKAANLR